MSFPPPQDPHSGQSPQPPPYPQQPPGPGQPPQGPPPGAPQYVPPPGAHPNAGPPQPPYGPGQPPYGHGPQQPYGQQPPYGPPPQKQGMSTGAKIAFGIGAAIIVLVLVIGTVLMLPLGDGGDEIAAPEASATDEDTAQEEENEDGGGDDNTIPEPDAEVFTGTDEDFIELDEPHNGARILSVEADESASVFLLGPNDETYASAGSRNGETHRVLYHHFSFEEYDDVIAIQVSGMGDWTVTLEPISSAVPWTDPDEPLEGQNSEIYSVDWDVSGEDVVAEHNGESNFAIWAMDLNEGNFELLVNEIGPYEGTVTLPSGTTLLEVAAEDEWSLTVS